MPIKRYLEALKIYLISKHPKILMGIPADPKASKPLVLHGANLPVQKLQKKITAFRELQVCLTSERSIRLLEGYFTATTLSYVSINQPNGGVVIF